MKSFKKWLGITKNADFELIHIEYFHKDLSEKQVLYLEQLIDNHRNRGMAICRCDVERVLEMCNRGMNNG